MARALNLFRDSHALRKRSALPFRGEDTTLLNQPAAFFEGLKLGIQSATSRISLASLYVNMCWVDSRSCGKANDIVLPPPPPPTATATTASAVSSYIEIW